MIYLFIFCISFILTYMVKEFAIKKSLFAIPNERSSHTTPTPHGGGIAIVLTWFGGISYLYVNNLVVSELYFALIVGLVLSVVSFLDDVYELDPRTRILVQLIVSMLGIYLLGGLQKIDIGFIVLENKMIINILAVIATIWFINLYNFLDGIDGHAGSEAIFLALSGYMFFSNQVYLILAVSVLGFLVWNWHKAKIFMGDVSSTLLGYNVAIFAMYHQNEGDSILIWIVLFGLFWFDATVTLFRRWRKGESLSVAHKKHAYQRLVQAGWRHDKVVLFGVVVNLLLFTSVYFVSNVATAFILGVLVLFVSMKIVDRIKPFL